MKNTPMQEIISLIPDAGEIKAFISEYDADEKMLDEWLWERIFKGNDWISKESAHVASELEKTSKSDI